ncbi:MAG: DNA polymerase III subunit epsilon [Flavobacteriia bacterium]|nr:MAG: DNA polymerase III subunit epsilon [Flavobacteriia bacterium]
MNYAILDIETTGGKYNEESITEIAIHKFDGHNVVDTLISLVNPEREIQPFVVKLTGINNTMLKKAPKFYEIAKRIIEITNDCVLVAHNSNFDYRILKTEFRRLGYDFDIPTLCTLELSKKLIPGLESYSLGKLCRTIGIPVSDRHRANGDALATVKLFELLMQKDIRKEIIKKSIKSGNKRDLSQKLLKILDELPSKTGVFYMHRYNGDIIYIGKGRDIKKSVNKVFLRNSKYMRQMLKEMADVTYEETGSTLVKRIKYLEEITQHKPKYNKKLNHNEFNFGFSNPNMIIIDKGKNLMEKSVLLIEDNQFKGYGFTDLNHQIDNIEILRSLVTQNKYSYKFNNIIHSYLQKEKVEKIIRF